MMQCSEARPQTSMHDFAYTRYAIVLNSRYVIRREIASKGPYTVSTSVVHQTKLGHDPGLRRPWYIYADIQAYLDSNRSAKCRYPGS